VDVVDFRRVWWCCGTNLEVWCHGGEFLLEW
jgi:hypothetical protein